MTTAAEQPISKSEFARRRNVVPGRVTQWIAAGKINGAALVGEGRSAQIVESIAVAQLRERLDISQRFGNGLDTRLPPPAAPSEASQANDRPAPLVAPAPSSPRLNFDPPIDPVDEQIKREKLEQIQRVNRRGAIDEAEKLGRLVAIDQVTRQMGRIAGQMLTVFEGSLPQLANAIAAKFAIPQRDVLHLMRQEMRSVRLAAAASAREAAESMPQTTAVEVNEQPDTELPEMVLQ